MNDRNILLQSNVFALKQRNQSNDHLHNWYLTDPRLISSMHGTQSHFFNFSMRFEQLLQALKYVIKTHFLAPLL